MATTHSRGFFVFYVTDGTQLEGKSDSDKWKMDKQKNPYPVLDSGN